MKEVLEKITSYNLFNYLLPGVLFAVILDKLTIYSIHQENIATGAFVYYFAGLMISRFGSLLVEPFLKKIGFLKFAPRKDFITASNIDAKIEILSEGNNMYRTFSAMFILIILLKLYESAGFKFQILSEWIPYIFIVVLLSMFLFSYKKQTAYITNRIEHISSSKYNDVDRDKKTK